MLNITSNAQHIKTFVKCTVQIIFYVFMHVYTGSIQDFDKNK